MTTPSLYVGTYAKYNNGSIAGAWVDLTQFADAEAFYKHCAELHKDEADPEFMFQDFEGFPEHFYSESGVTDELFEFLALDDNEKALLEAYIECTGIKDATLNDAEEAFYGQYESDLDLAYEYVESTGMLGECNEVVARYFDYEAFARDLAYDFMSHNGYYFHN